MRLTVSGACTIRSTRERSRAPPAGVASLSDDLATQCGIPPGRRPDPVPLGPDANDAPKSLPGGWI
eukprot:2317444-Lingulodinium_polyedra.AAC.1